MNFKLTIFPDVDNSNNRYKKFEFETQKEMNAAVETVASMLIFVQDCIKIMPCSSNVFIMEQFVNGEWEEIDE